LDVIWNSAVEGYSDTEITPLYKRKRARAGKQAVREGTLLRCVCVVLAKGTRSSRKESAEPKIENIKESEDVERNETKSEHLWWGVEM